MDSRNLPSLAQLVAAVLAGDEGAQLTLHERCNLRFQRFAIRYLSRKGCCTPEQHGFDAVNFAWGKIFRKLSTLREHDKFIPWALRIVRNEANEHLRQCINKQNYEVSFDSLMKKAADESPEKELSFDPASIVSDVTVIHNSLLVDEILNLAQEISPALYKILHLQRVEGLTLAAIAERLGVSPANTRLIRSRGIRELKKRLAPKEAELKERSSRQKKDIE